MGTLWGSNGHPWGLWGREGHPWGCGVGIGTLWGSNGHPWGLWGGDGDPTGQQWAPTDAPHPLSYALWGSEPPLIPLISASDAAERTAERERERAPNWVQKSPKRLKLGKEGGGTHLARRCCPTSGRV